MISSNFGFGEQSAIASAYARMYAPTRVTESCCKEGKCEGKKCDAGNLPRKHAVPKGTGSKLGKRKMMEFKKRDAKPTAKKFTPKVTKTLTEGFCITDGNKTLCTNDQNESYFNKDGISNETRIYESAVSALKDIKKINSKRKAQRKYGIRKCECVGESFQFSTKGTPVNEGWFGFGDDDDDAQKTQQQQNSAGAAQGQQQKAESEPEDKDDGGSWWNPLNAVKNIAGGAANLVGGAVKGVGNLASAAGNAVTGDFDAAGKNLGDAWDNAKQAGGGIAQAASPVTGAIGAGVDAAKAGAEAVKNSATQDGGVLNTIGGAVKDTVGNVVGGAANTVGGAVKAAGNLAGAAGNALTGDFDAAGKNLGNAVDNAKQAAGGVAQAASPVLGAAGGALKTVGKGAEALGSMVSPNGESKTDATKQNGQQPQQPSQNQSQNTPPNAAAKPNSTKDRIRKFREENARVDSVMQNSAANNAKDPAKQQLNTSMEEINKTVSSGGQPQQTTQPQQTPQPQQNAAPTKSSLQAGSATAQPQQTAPNSTQQQSKAGGADNQAKIKELTQQKEQIEKQIAELQKAQTAAYQSTLPQTGKNWSFN